MGWRDLLATGNETVVLPWVGGRSLRSSTQIWSIEGRLPNEHGWYQFKLEGRKAKDPAPVEPQPDSLSQVVTGYLVGDRLVAEAARVDPDPAKIVSNSEKVYLVSDALDRFARVSAGRPFEDGPLIYRQQEMPLGAEEDVLNAFLNDAPSVADVKGVPPALDAAFRMEAWQRAEAVKRRLELERIRREEEEKRLAEERKQQLLARLGDAKGRRDMAIVDFAEAARAALAVGGAAYLDHRKAPQKGETIVRFRLDGQRFECVCDGALRIVDAGICLIDHATGKKGDRFFTLESLPGVIRQAQRERRLVVFRHV